MCCDKINTIFSLPTAVLILHYGVTGHLSSGSSAHTGDDDGVHLILCLLGASSLSH